MAADYWQLVEPAWDSLVRWDSTPEFLSVFNSADPKARTLFAAHWLYSEVCNGGFQQFYWNSTGILAPEARQAYEDLGMPRTAEIIQKSMGWFPAPYSRDRDARIALLEKHEADHGEDRSPFADLDDKFYDVVESEHGGFIYAANEYAAHKP